MSKIDPIVLDQIEAGASMQVKSDSNGMPIAWKGPWLPDWFDNYMECHKENQAALRIKKLKAEGKNENGQTPEQEKEFKHRAEIQQQRKQKAEAALLASKDFTAGK